MSPNPTTNRRTIYAPASGGIGQSALSIIRVSGPHALDSLKSLLPDSHKIPAPRQATPLRLINPQTRKIIDHALVLYFAAPASFTGEDVVEYHLHGGRAVFHSMMEYLSSYNDHQMAMPGEFTRRAFENGKIDLTQAEAVADLIAAETEAQQSQALDQLGGGLSALYASWREMLIESAAYLEAVIDFADEDIGQDQIFETIGPKIKSLHQDITDHIADARLGERLREGISIAVIGAPNAGKSTLVNALARRDVCITSDLEGTTRDVIEVHLNLGGYPVIVSDTAGLRPGQIGDQGHDKIEQEGIRRALDVAANADIRLLVFDGRDLPNLHTDTLNLKRENDFILINKSDLKTVHLDTSDLDLPHPSIVISSKTEDGIDLLTDQIVALIGKILPNRQGPVPTRARHREALIRAQDALSQAIDSITSQTPYEFIAEDLRAAARAIGHITGRVDVDSLLDVIFNDFCIGK